MKPRRVSWVAASIFCCAFVFGSASFAVPTGPIVLPGQDLGSGVLLVNGEAGGDNLGNSADYAGDFNGDGYDDIVVGAPLSKPLGMNQGGETYVIYGGPKSPREVVDLAQYSSNALLSKVTKIVGEDAGYCSGMAVAGAGDVNGDKLADIIIGSPQATGPRQDSTYAGAAHVVFGSRSFPYLHRLLDTDGTNGFRAQPFELDTMSSNTYEQLGMAVAGVGDINDDGYHDIAILGKVRGIGRVSVIFGHSGSFPMPFWLTTLNGTNGFRGLGENSGDFDWGSLAGAGDVNGDEIDDVIIGASFATANNRTGSGRSYLLFGHEGPWDADIMLGSIEWPIGVTIDGAAAGDYSGCAVGSAGDINGDGFGDIIIGSPLAEIDGRAYVIFGHNDTWAAIDLAALNGSNGFVVHGPRTDGEGYFGVRVSGGGDINSDGIDDIVVGADATPAIIFGHRGDWASAPIETDTLNTTGLGLQLFWPQTSSYPYHTEMVVSINGDINGDGTADALFAAWNADAPSTTRRRADSGQLIAVIGLSNVTSRLPSSAVSSGSSAPFISSSAAPAGISSAARVSASSRSNGAPRSNAVAVGVGIGVGLGVPIVAIGVAAAVFILCGGPLPPRFCRFRSTHSLSADLQPPTAEAAREAHRSQSGAPGTARAGAARVRRCCCAAL